MDSQNTSKRIFSGIQPSGNIHIGNYLGAIKQWVDLQDKVEETIFCIVDLHAITVPQDPKDLQRRILELTALYIACGIDPEKSPIFIQSSRPEHSELAWILNCFTSMGELKRMTQFKDKSGENQDRVTAGLFDYPVLMAADILLYNTTDVPVGEDQVQHIEITRDIAERFNNKFGETFVMPRANINKETTRIMGLDDPTKKMSKSASSEYNFVAMSDDAETIRNKIKRAVTDSGSQVKATDDKLAIRNLLNIFSGVTGKSISELEQEFEGKNYGEFKNALSDALIALLAPIQKKYHELLSNPDELRNILARGSERAAPIAQKTLQEVKKKVGLG
jgi:tryptophanyl-tRNA synthetase